MLCNNATNEFNSFLSKQCQCISVIFCIFLFVLHFFLNADLAVVITSVESFCHFAWQNKKSCCYTEMFQLWPYIDYISHRTLWVQFCPCLFIPLSVACHSHKASKKQNFFGSFLCVLRSQVMKFKMMFMEYKFRIQAVCLYWELVSLVLWLLLKGGLVSY